MFTREVELESVGRSLLLSQEVEGDVGCVVWDAAIVLAKYLEVQEKGKRKLLEGSTVIELGAGTGCAGLAAALLGASRVTLTDLPDLLPLLEINRVQNLSGVTGVVEVQELTWGNSDQIQTLETPDVILLADCIYYGESLEPLVSTVKALSGANTTVIMSHEQRTDGNKPELQRRFFALMEKYFTQTHIAVEDQHEVYRSEDILIHEFKKRNQ
ncbi:protein N-lysine methyltransferase METTL21D-like [Eriocheir sinensis]|uniref:protein N-lysine methyltransferase METTL21D-like n=1 Tax=Eriocheir sinensis TaxID=95602 RepID=UPI0021CA6F54|nr:protein N-lysine methyltransferase METTL21D-like [Eriocheir sinensis]